MTNPLEQMALNYFDRVANLDKIGTKLQEEVNQTQFPAEAKQIIRIAMSASHAELPQYNDHWDDSKYSKYIVLRVTQDVITKRGKAFLKGDIVLGRPDENIIPDSRESTWVVCSLRNGFTETSVTTSRLEVV